ncbi:hypothetical protein [Clostridium fallax]|uniref:Uncharacterized protein n=1 Tax=Clostridium fallax TaxID=1533 RepID=A0A1M4WF59_9CLOT|nr:hypothetical protein [Clostridium fallax]SHE79703.1 hypothetical protein SAMN05443638_11210 [Clostridium fallax]SQB04933.1 Uncharacterised protein [Clostridium fallax]
MIKLGKVCTFMGEILGLSTEIIIRGSGTAINTISNVLDKDNKIKKNKIEKSSIEFGDKISKYIVNTVKDNEEKIDLKSTEIIEKIKDVKENAYKSKTVIYGDPEYLYGKENIIYEDYEVHK